MKRVALIVAGGAGERFWPYSTKHRPKQLLKLTESGQVMLEEAVDRIKHLFGIESVFVITSPHLVEAIEKEIPSLTGRAYAEPEKKNTAGAIVWGMAMVARQFPDEPLSFAILASDHLIRPTESFQAKIEEALDVSEQLEKLVTIGIVPDRPETGYGYIKKGQATSEHSFSVAHFREKPDAETAANYLASGDYLWNSGMFFWRTDTFLEEFAKAWVAEGDIFGATFRAVRDDKDAAAKFNNLPNLSIDHALLERSKNVAVLESNFDWDDLGAWDALQRVFPSDDAGNMVRGEALALESTGCIIFNSNPGMCVNVLGLHDLVVVATEDTIMIVPKGRVQEVRKLAAERQPPT